MTKIALRKKVHQYVDDIGENALEAVYKILKNYVEDNLATIDTPALPGKPLSTSEFKKWIEQAEKKPTISLAEAKAKWNIRKKQLQ